MTTITEIHSPIDVEIHRKALDNISREMAITLRRTSGSPVVNEGNDFCTCFMDANGEHLGFAAYVLFHAGSSLVGTKAVIDSLDEVDDVRPGDAWIVNDPYEGGAAHQADVAVITPMFHRDEIVGWAFSNMHVLDVGGVGVSGYAPGARSVYEEGLRLPPVRAIRDGAIGPEWERCIAANVRTPGPVLNDIRSLIAANNRASEKLGELIERYGYERHREFCEINKALTEKLFRERISALRDGVYRTTEWNEFDGHDGPDLLLELSCALTISGSDLHFEFEGVPQVDAFVNSTKGAMYGQTMAAILVTMAYGDLPFNAGMWRPVSIDLGEPGTIVNATAPAPVSNAHSEVGMRAAKMVRDLLSQAFALSDEAGLRVRVGGTPPDGFPIVPVAGENQNGGTSVLFYVDTAVGGGGPALSFRDGQDHYGLTPAGGGSIPTVEGHEAVDPLIVLWRRLIPNSGGPGRFRGGQALELACELAYADHLDGPGTNACAEMPQRGFGGGYPAATGDWWLVRGTNRTELAAVGRLPLFESLTGDRPDLASKVDFMRISRGDALVLPGGGGSGLGDPLLRPIGEIETDLRHRYITAHHAAVAYGVVVGDDGITIDAESTRAKREATRRARIGSDPALPLDDPGSVGVSVLWRDRSGHREWVCGYCDSSLCSDHENWRTCDAVVRRERPLVEFFAEMDMRVRARREAPDIMAKEHFCGRCAGLLTLDVAPEDHPPFPQPVLV